MTPAAERAHTPPHAWLRYTAEEIRNPECDINEATEFVMLVPEVASALANHDTLKQQNAALVAALTDLLKFAERSAFDCDLGSDPSEEVMDDPGLAFPAIVTARAALAKCGGPQP